MRFFTFCLSALLLSSSIYGQNLFFHSIEEQNIRWESKDERRIDPDIASYYEIDPDALWQRLLLAPDEDYNNYHHGLELIIPYPDGHLETFVIWRTHTLHPDLGAKFPGIRTFVGMNKRRKQETIWLDMTPFGFHAMVLGADNGQIFIDPYLWPNNKYCQSYYKKDLLNAKDFQCQYDGEVGIDQAPVAVAERYGLCGNMRRYRLALACTGEYAAFHGGTTAGVTSAMASSMNRVNGIYRTEMSVELQIIANNASIIYLNAATDPYTNTNGSTMLTENQNNLTSVIGGSNYDVGHVFSTGGGGVAALGSICSTSNKARGVTGSGSPVGDPFDIDYVAHEMGHQFGGNHCFANSCSSNRNALTAMEPGSGYSIMAYAGICSPNVQSNSDAWFHPINLKEIAARIAAVSTCPQYISNSNSAPTVTALPNYTIPKSTPIILSTSATDPNGDAITYSWEEMDSLTTNQTMPPVSTNTQGPLTMGFAATTSGTRYIPRLSNLTANTSFNYEVLPSVARLFKFVVLVRDNKVSGGCTTQDEVIMTADGTAGPFTVSTPTATGLSFLGASSYTVTWAVASTNVAPVNCSNVSIYLSTDGGFTYPTTLLANTPNDGSQSITWPNITATQCRVMVKGDDNVFFDISNNNFALTQVLPVDLTRFDAAKNDFGGVNLKWETASEADLSHFVVERSINATEWQKVTEVPAVGNSIGLQTYKTSDQNVPKAKRIYYRLQTIELSGSATISPMRTVESTTAHYELFPNPTQQTITLKTDQEYQTWNIQLYQADGSLVRSANLFGELRLEWNLEDLPAGNYTLQMDMDGKISSEQIIKF